MQGVDALRPFIHTRKNREDDLHGFFALFYANGDLAFLGPGQVLVIDEGEGHLSREVLLGEIVEASVIAEGHRSMRVLSMAKCMMFCLLIIPVYSTFSLKSICGL